MRFQGFGLALAGLVLLSPERAAAGWFTDNGEREALQILRDRASQGLSRAEEALLTAANRTGWVLIAECGLGSNGVLVSTAEADYVITSLHLLIGKLPGDQHCDPADGAVFYPNVSYEAPGREEIPAAFLAEHIALEPAPLNYSHAGTAMPWVEDWVAYRLSRRVSTDIMPEGTWGAGGPRGAFEIPEKADPQSAVYVLGYDGRFDQLYGWQFSWQKCRQRRQPFYESTIWIDCDIYPGASSSPVMALRGDEMVLLGIVSATMQALEGPDVPVPQSAHYWNVATASGGMRRQLMAAE